MSAPRQTWKPPPNATPCTAAITGTGSSRHTQQAYCARLAGPWLRAPRPASFPATVDCPRGPSVMRPKLPMSSPAQKARPSPESTTARTPFSVISRSPAPTRPSNMALSRAFILSARFGRTSATPSSIEIVTRSFIRSELHHVELRLGHLAVRAFPVVRDVGPAGAGRDALFGQALGFVVDEAAGAALVGLVGFGQRLRSLGARHATRAAVVDLVEVFRQAIAHFVADPVLGHALGDPGVQLLAVRALAPAAQRDQRDHLALDLVLAPAAGLHVGAEARLVAVLVPVGVHLALDDVVVDPVHIDHAALARHAVLAGDDREHHPEVAAEVHRAPAIPVDRRPMARPPRFIAQAKAVDFERLLADLERPLGGHVLLVVGAGEALLGVQIARRAVLAHRLAAVHGAHALVVELDLARDVRVVAEGGGRVGHLERFGQHADLALEGELQLL